MPTYTVKISPLTRIEGHLDVTVTADTVGGKLQVVDAQCAGTMFRGFEKILIGRAPRDATHMTQRICGVCPISHGMASSLALEQAFNVQPMDNGRIIRNLILGANYIQSHVLHFYHLCAPDYVDVSGTLNMSPWNEGYTATDLVTGATGTTLVNHYVQALSIRRKAHQMGAIFSGRMPTAMSTVPGGSSGAFTAADVTAFRTILTELRAFIDSTLVPDAQLLAQVFTEYYQYGGGPGNLLAYGVFDLNVAGTSKLLSRGIITNGVKQALDTTKIREYVYHSYYTPACTNLALTDGVTEPSPDKQGAYSWLKAPRYNGGTYEVGPLARMYVNGDYTRGVSAMDRIVARALEAQKIANAMDGWLNQLVPGTTPYRGSATPQTGTGVGLTEAPRGALGHWVKIASAKISAYQVLSPTGWNASPRDDSGQAGAMEMALVGTPLADVNNPIEVLRVVHSFDPCLACSVHMVRPGQKVGVGRRV